MEVDILSFITNNGLGIGLSIYFVITLNKTLAQHTEAINKLILLIESKFQ